jgi:alkylated DNA repair dioxygenase AlkB
MSELICIAITKAGIPCKHKAKEGNVCGIHKNYKIADLIPYKTAILSSVSAVSRAKDPQRQMVTISEEDIKSENKEIQFDYKKYGLQLLFRDVAGTLALLKGKFAEIDLAIQSFKSIHAQMLVNPPIITPFGKQGKQNRSISFVSDQSKGYEYSNQLMPSIKLTPENKKLLQYVNTYLGGDYNGILWNKYNSGDDYLGAHSDDERNLGKIGVFSITLWFDSNLNPISDIGRTFRIHNKKNPIDLVFNTEIKTCEGESVVCDLELQHGDSCLMYGEFQKSLKHSIPVRKKIKHIRVSATFRKHLI